MNAGGIGAKSVPCRLGNAHANGHRHTLRSADDPMRYPPPVRNATAGGNGRRPPGRIPGPESGLSGQPQVAFRSALRPAASALLWTPQRHFRLVQPDPADRDKGAADTEKSMDKQDAPQSASLEEEARIAETPAIFANKVHVLTLPDEVKITFAEPRRFPGEDRPSLRVPVILQHADLAALHRLLGWALNVAQTPPESIGGSLHQVTERTFTSIAIARPPRSAGSSACQTAGRPQLAARPRGQFRQSSGYGQPAPPCLAA